MNPIVIKLGGYQGPTSIHTRAAAHFGEALRRELGEHIVFELVGDVLALGRKSGDLPTMVESGALALCYMSTVRFAPKVPELEVLELPFVVRDRRSAIAALDGELGALFRDCMHARTAFRALGFWDNGFRHVTNKVRAIRRPQDCKGIRIRTQMSALHGEALSAMGFDPIAADISEFTAQIGSDRFQAQENPLTNTFHFGVHRHHRHITLTGHFFGASALVCNEKLFRSWPRPVQYTVESAARKATAFQHELAAAADEEVLAQIDPRENELVHLTNEERDQFVGAVDPVVRRYRQLFDPRLFDYLQ